MGSEIECTMISAGKTVRGKAYLETNELVFRGATRAVLPLRELRGVSAEGGVLRLRHGGKSYAFSLGAQAARWKAKIENPKGRLDKLGVKPGAAVCVVSLDEPDFAAELEARGVRAVKKEADVVFFGVRAPADLGRVAKLKSTMKKDGALWIVRPKGGKGVTERETTAAGKKAGLVDVKVVSFSEVLTAEKFVIPLKDR
jgi:hypothetical protein